MSGSKDLPANPFAALFTSLPQTQPLDEVVARNSEKTAGTCALDMFVEISRVVPIPDTTLKQDRTTSDLAQEKLDVDRLLERIFLVTLDNEAGTELGRPSRCVYLGEALSQQPEQTWLEIDTLEQIVFERLMLEDPGQHVVVTRVTPGSGSELREASLAGESEVLRYLFTSYQRLKEISQEAQVEKYAAHLKKCEEVILLNAKTCLQQPLLFPSQQFHKQFVDIYRENEHAKMGSTGDYMVEFFEKVAVEIDENQEDGTLLEALKPVFNLIKKNIVEGINYGINNTSAFQHMGILYFFTRKQCMAEAFMTYNSPAYWDIAQTYEKTLLGVLLSTSCIPKSQHHPNDLFPTPSQMTRHDQVLVESSIWQSLQTLSECIHRLLYAIIRLSPDLKHRVLTWLGSCLHANKGRSKIQMNQFYCTDGFSLNLCNVLLRFCQPFSEPNSPKLLKIQPSYITATPTNDQESRQMNVHLRGLSEMTCLIANDDVPKLPPLATYSFITECFYMAQYGIHQSFYPIHNKLKTLNKHLHDVQRLYADLQAQAGADANQVRLLKRDMEKGMSMFLCMKAALTEPTLLDLCVNFHVASATWLAHVATTESRDRFVPIQFPLSLRAPSTLAYIPEMFVENLTDFMLFLHRFKDSLFESEQSQLGHMMTFILVFMGSPERMRNPHHRAELAEVLRALMPTSSEGSPFSQGLLSTYNREQLFKSHPLIEHLAETLLHVFVVIEMTGQNVDFEMKFQYRQPMYAILDYIWKIDVHKDALIRLSKQAEDEIEATDAPLFLRFVNLLINDATFLLDEALQHMSEIKIKQQEKDSGAWERLGAEERATAYNNFRLTSRLAHVYNIMSNSTIHTLTFLTEEIRSIFTHNVLRDRVAAMLNYFLLHLVGPKQKNFVVKDKNEYEFKPDQIVSHITQMYIHLGEEDRFCAAVSADGRSYSRHLFPKAVTVLQKIGRPPQVIGDFLALEEKINALGERQQEEEDLLANAPEEFLDPIMGTLMKDPVTLPGSKQIVDRSVIARHILSDQTDPFNRQPLTMDMVVPETELRDRILKWIETRGKQT